MYLLKEIYQLITLQVLGPMQIILIKKILFRNCTPFTDCISTISNTQVDNAKDIDIVMPMYSLIEYSNNY